MKTEIWNNHEIRFVQVDEEWVGIAKDISDALGYRDANSMTKKINSKYSVYAKMADMNQKYLALTEFGIYKAIFNSKKPEAEQFQEWVFNVIKALRENAGIEGFQIFRTLDKEHQKQMMSNLSKSLKKPVRKDFIKANTIANKAVSTANGYPKMIKKAEMSPTMLAQRETILKDAVELMGMKDKYGLDLSVSKTIYKKVSVNE